MLKQYPTKLIAGSLLLIGLLASITSSVGEVYRRTLPNGTVEFTDFQKGDAERPLQLENIAPAMVVPGTTSPSTPQGTSDTLNLPDQLSQYETEGEEMEKASADIPTIPVNYSINITSPSNEQAIKNNAGNLSVSVAVTPRLSEDLFITLTSSSGMKAGPQKSQRFSFTNLDRGSHTFIATVANASGKVIKRSAPVTVHLQRHSVLFQRRKPQ
jgi:hypothetical protein